MIFSDCHESHSVDSLHDIIKMNSVVRTALLCCCTVLHCACIQSIIKFLFSIFLADVNH